MGLLGKELEMKFERFSGVPHQKHAMPGRMNVGQIVIRKNVKRAYVAQLKQKMRRAMRDEGMEFSISWDGPAFAIRRDK